MARHKTHAQPAASAPGARLGATIFYALLMLIVLTPIPLGSNRGWSWSLSALALSIIALAWLLNTLFNQRRVALSLPLPIIALFLIPCLWALIQTTSLVPEPWSHPLWEMAADTLQTPVPASASIAPDNTYTALMRLLSYGLVFFLVFQYCRNPNRARTVLTWLAIAGVFYAFYGLLAYWNNTTIFSSFQPAAPISGGGSTLVNKVTSTFVNRNHYANYAGLGLVCLIALSFLVTLRQHGPDYTPPGKKVLSIESYFLRSWKPLLGLLLISTALISTQSRGGFISAAIGVSVLLIIYGIKRKSSKKMLLTSIAGMCLMIMLAYSISSEALLGRMTRIDSEGAERITVFGLTLDATLDSPWTGFGYGSFYEGFKLYRNEDVQYTYDKAHNTYLENLFELGIPAALSLFLALAGLVLLTLRGVIQRHRYWIYPSTGLAATGLVASHAMIDFSLQIPAVAITYSAIMGMAVAQSIPIASSHGAHALRKH